MAISKHNLWKRKKNGLMKLVRYHSDWLDRRRKMKTDKGNTVVKSSPWREKETTEKSTVKTKPTVSTKRTQVGKKV